MTRKRKIILGLIVGAMLLMAVIVVLYILILQRSLSPIFSPNAAPTKATYQNPFAKPTQPYENPFSEYQNPFEDLK